MVQILDSKKSGLSRFLQHAEPGIDAFAEHLLSNKKQKQQDQQRALEDTALERIGVDVKGITNPKIREKLLDQNIKNKQASADISGDSERAQVIGKYFGPQAAEVYPHLTEGGKTKFFEVLLEGKQRNIPITEILTQFVQQNPEDVIIPDEFKQQGAEVSPEGQQNQPAGQQRNNVQSKPRLTPKEQVAADQKQIEFNKTFQSKRSSKILEEVDDMRKNLPLQQANIDLIKSAVLEGNIGGLDQDYVAEILHFEPLRTVKGTQLKSAGKDLFIKTLQGTGARPNQWIEQQIGSALTQIGKSAEANLTIAEIAQFQKDLNNKKVEAVDQLEDKYQEELGYVPGKIGREADKEVQKYAEKRQEELAYDLRKLYETELGEEKLKNVTKVPVGTPLTREMARILYDKTDSKKSIEERKKEAEAKAKKIGFTIPGKEIYSR